MSQEILANLSVSMQRDCKKCGSDFTLIYVNTPEKMVRQRHIENRVNPIRHDVKDKDFEEIIKNFEPPTVDENFIIFNQTHNIDQWISNLLSPQLLKPE
jgi:tRNA uridine 5-carbamoylmethylation protein Kti12